MHVESEEPMADIIIAKSMQVLIQSFCMRIRRLDPVLNIIIAQAFEDTALSLEATISSCANQSRREFIRKVLDEIEHMRDEVFHTEASTTLENKN
jgi:hypothetical protein